MNLQLEIYALWFWFFDPFDVGSRSSWQSSSVPLLLCSTSTINEFITCFYESWIYEFSSRNFMFHFLEGCKVSFFVMINSYTYWHFFYLKRKILPCRKTKQRKFRRFRNRENMWWAWPIAISVSLIVLIGSLMTSSS